MAVAARQGARARGRFRVGYAAGQWLGDKVPLLCYRFLRWAGLAEAPTLEASDVERRVQCGRSTVVRPPPPSATRLKSALPILSILQKRAAWELFDWLGLDMVPIAYSRILGETRDPADALAKLVVRYGLDPLKVRRRDSGELEAFRTIVRLTCQLEQPPGRILEHGGDDLLLRELFVTLDEVLELFKTSPAPSRSRRFILLFARIESLQQRPGSVTIKEANAVLEEARGLAAASWRHAAAAERYREAIAELNAGWAQWGPTIDDNAARQRGFDAATAAERRLFDDADCDIEEQLAAHTAAVNALQSLIHDPQERAHAAAEEERARRIEEKRRRDLQEERRRQRQQEEARKREQDRIRVGRSATSDKEPSQMSLDELLVFFSFEPGSRPTSAQVKSAFMVMAQLTQPRPGDANFVAKNSRYRQVIDAFKTLKATMDD
jgi:hypothetical protein